MNNSFDGRVVPIINGFKKYDNGGKGSGNFGHEGRPGQVGGSGEGGKGVASSKPVYDTTETGMAPLLVAKDGEKYKAKSFADEENTRRILEADGLLKEVLKIPYRKNLKGEKVSDNQKQVWEKISGIRLALSKSVTELGDAMTFKDREVDWDKKKSLMDYAGEELTKAQLSIADDKSKVGVSLKKAVSLLSDARDRLVKLDSEKSVRSTKEPTWHDIDDMVKR